MRFAAQKTLHFQDMLPADGSIYVTDMIDKGGAMMKALRDWEKRRGISFSFKGKFIAPRPKKGEEKPKEKAKSDRPIVVPREKGRPGRKKEFTAEEKRQRKNENNKQYRAKNNAEARARSKEWRANLTPEQREQVRAKHREWKRAQAAKRLAAADKGNGSGTAGVPLANSDLQGKKG